MSANATTAAPTGRKKLAQGKDAAPAADAALGNTPPHTSSPEGAKEGWRSVALGEIVEINPRFGKDELADDSLASFIPMKCVEEESGRFEPLGDRKVSEVSKGYTPFRDGDVIFAKVTPCMENGKAAVLKGLTNGVGFGSTEFFALRPKRGLVVHYLFHFILQSNFRREAARNMTGAVGLRRVPKSWLEQQTIPLPEPDEQRRIVAEIEKQFTRLEAGVAALRRVQANLKRYRAAVLKAACEGQLVPTEADLARKEARAFETGEALLERILARRKQVFEEEKARGGRKKYTEPSEIEPGPRPDFPEGWTIASAEAVCSSVRDGTHDTPGYFPEGVPLITSKNLLPSGLDFENVKFISKEDYLEISKRSGVDRGDILFAMIGTIGNPVVVETDAEFSIKNVGLFKGNPEFILPRFLRYWFMSPTFVRWLEPKQKGTTQKFVPLGLLRALAVTLPPLAEQTRIVAEVERRLSVVEELESVVSANLQRAVRLRQSILQKAFTGELV